MVKNKESWGCLCSCALNTLPQRPALFLSRPFCALLLLAPHVAAQIEKAAETSCFGVESRLREAYNECTTFRQSKAFRTEIYVMIILTQPISKSELSELAKTYFGDMVKGVADVDKGLVSLDAELHSDLEAMLLDQGMISHPSLHADGRWAAMSFAQQMGNIGSEVSRACKWKEKHRPEMMEKAFYRGLELLDLTIALSHGSRLRELLRAREVMCDFFAGDNVYQSTTRQMKQYYDVFAFMK